VVPVWGRRMRICLASLMVAVLAAACDSVAGQQERGAPAERVEWWRDLKLGMFIHWGPWSKTGEGAIWKLVDKETTPAERARLLGQYGRFDAPAFDADAWAALARHAGMRYVVFTAKHHDGFSNFDTRYSDFRVTALGHGSGPGDVTAALVKAFRREGLGVGLYYSNLDWHHPDGVWHKRRWDYVPLLARYQPERWRRFVEFETNQVRELLTRYGPVDILWFDGTWHSGGVEADAAPMLDMARRLQPGLLIDDRGTLGYADFATSEQKMPSPPPRSPWEESITISEGLGYWYKGPNARYKSGAALVERLVQVVAGGGNLLIDVGPRPDGSMVPQEVASLETLGGWLQLNGEAIYGTRPASPSAAPWGYLTEKPGRLFMIVSKWPAKPNTTIDLSLSWRPRRAYLLATGSDVPLRYDAASASARVSLPAAPATLPVVVVLAGAG
jgi:alpha-L-fucosidase